MPSRYKTPKAPSADDPIDDDRLVQLSRSLTSLDLNTALSVLNRSRKERSYALAYLEGLHRRGFYELPGRTKDAERSDSLRSPGITAAPGRADLPDRETCPPTAPFEWGGGA